MCAFLQHFVIRAHCLFAFARIRNCSLWLVHVRFYLFHSLQYQVKNSSWLQIKWIKSTHRAQTVYMNEFMNGRIKTNNSVLAFSQFNVRYTCWSVSVSVHHTTYCLNTGNQCNIETTQYIILTCRYRFTVVVVHLFGFSTIWFFDWCSFSNSMPANICTKSKLQSSSYCLSVPSRPPRSAENFQWSRFNNCIKSYTLYLDLITIISTILHGLFPFYVNFQ